MADKIKKLNWWHESLIDWLIANPGSKLGEAAKFFDVTAGWLSSIMSSDLFKVRFAERLEEHRHSLDVTINDRVVGVTHLSLELLEEKLQEERESLSFTQVKDAAELSLKAAGYSGRSGAALNVNVNNSGNGAVTVNAVDSETLHRARERLALAQENRNNPAAIEHTEPEEVLIEQKQGVEVLPAT